MASSSASSSRAGSASSSSSSSPSPLSSSLSSPSSSSSPSALPRTASRSKPFPASASSPSRSISQGSSSRPRHSHSHSHSPSHSHSHSHSPSHSHSHWRNLIAPPSLTLTPLLLPIVLLALPALALALPIPSPSPTPSPYPSHVPAPAPPLSETEGGLSSLTRDKWIGLGLAISSSLAIGTSFIITKKGLIDAAERGPGLASDGHTYLQNPIWWAGMLTMIVGEVANFAAYTFAPPILVTPLGALSVLIGAVLASFILKEELGRLGRVGCTLCLVGTVIIILNAPEDKEIRTVDEILNYALQPGFMFYCTFVFAFAIFMIWRMVPRYGKRTPLVYISICSLVGSISVMSVKGFGVALKLTLDGNNQFTHPSTYCFAIVVIVCILVQMNYFNKALDQFSTNVVNPIYYVMFTTSTILASFILFRGFNTSGAAPAISLLCGFIVIFMGVYLLNLNRLIDPTTQQPRMSLVTGQGVAGTGRLSEHHERLLNGDASGMMNSRMSMSGNNGGSGGRASFSAEAHGLPRRSSIYRNDHHNHGRRESAGSSVLFNAYDNEETVGLTQLNEDSEESDGASSMRSPRTPQSHGRSSSLRLGGKSRGGAGGAGGVGGGGAGGAGANHTRAIGSRDHGNARSTSGSRGRTSLLDGQGHGFAQGMDGEEGETEDHIHPSLAASSRNGRR